MPKRTVGIIFFSTMLGFNIAVILISCLLKHFFNWASMIGAICGIVGLLVYLTKKEPNGTT